MYKRCKAEWLARGPCPACPPCMGHPQAGAHRLGRIQGPQPLAAGAERATGDRSFRQPARSACPASQPKRSRCLGPGRVPQLRRPDRSHTVRSRAPGGPTKAAAAPAQAHKGLCPRPTARWVPGSAALQTAARSGRGIAVPPSSQEGDGGSGGLVALPAPPAPCKPSPTLLLFPPACPQLHHGAGCSGRPAGGAPPLPQDQGHQQGQLWVCGAGREPGEPGAGGHQVHTRRVSAGHPCVVLRSARGGWPACLGARFTSGQRLVRSRQGMSAAGGPARRYVSAAVGASTNACSAICFPCN